ncbi:hypothetical protein WH52_02310 [Tenacibaculum holothuriorum]|uniref:DUF4252 domain-containing protein n=1 Tax=Tenacibaculum holothuriorum TaxID=1635173 RepID=A0A1Y2PI57_9FLAO|nr:DUF4252 domain-containing protein [Tenacibaculum holothuriorum]OSY89487.1 hypothetical protein WH52_02310 [Tenacibaculum holothuriorum]
MKRFIIFTISMVMLTLISCNKPSLQKYIVDSQNDSKFVTVDFSASILPISMKENASEEDKKAFESIRKVNIAFLPENKSTKEEVKAEEQKIKTILKDSEYKTLMKFNDKKGKATLYYSGDLEAINEIVGFVNIKGAGVGVGRLLGENMNPNALMKMMRSVNVNDDEGKLQQFKDIIGNKIGPIK